MGKDIGIKPEKEIDLEFRTRFIRIYITLFAAFAIPLILIFGVLKGFFFDIILCFFLTIIAVFITSKIGDISKIIYSGRKSIIPLREQMQGSLKAVQVSKMNKEYKKALNGVNVILRKDPEFYEAMFVKAQILSQGFRNPENAKKYLKKVMDHTLKDETLHTWASSLYDELL